MKTMKNNYRQEKINTQILVIGSGAGGAVTAATLAKAGYSVVILEEGERIDTNTLETHSTEAMKLLYRNRGMTPIFGNTTIAYVEGCCVGGSTEINSAFWHRTPEDCINRWTEKYKVKDLSKDSLYKLFNEVEKDLTIQYSDPKSISRSSSLLKKGAEELNWSIQEIPRAQIKIENSQFAPGAKSSMSRTFIPAAIEHGVKILSNSKAIKINHGNGRVTSVLAVSSDKDSKTMLTIEAEHVFISGGAVQTPTLLLKSNINKNIGQSIFIHPMLKIAAMFEESLDSHKDPIPIYQIKEFMPDITIGGSVFTPGFLSMLFCDNWTLNATAMEKWQNMALYYAGITGKGIGRIRLFPFTNEPFISYRLSKEDQSNLSKGLAYISKLLFKSGAKKLFPAVRNLPFLETQNESDYFLNNVIPFQSMSLSTVHAFSSCPMGEDEDICAVNSFGKTYGFENLYISDASIIPDAPGVNPQGTIMALALRNAKYFLETKRGGELCQ